MTNQNTIIYACRRGERGSALRLNAEPTAEEWALLANLGFERARRGKRIRREVVCPVNGDGYWYTCCELLDADGTVVGSVEVPEGPSGEI